MLYRTGCILTGYLCGCFLTAEAVSRHAAGKSASRLGTGNPGMANIMAQLGFKWGLLVLAGDLLKTLFPCMLCRFLLFPRLGRNAVLYAGIGVAAGHNFPFWNRFRGGKGVAVTCMTLFIFSPGFGLLSCVLGGCLVLLSKSLTLGALAIPLLFLWPAFTVYGSEAGVLSCILAAMMLQKHFLPFLDYLHGKGTKIDLIAKAQSKLRERK